MTGWRRRKARKECSFWIAGSGVVDVIMAFIISSIISDTGPMNVLQGWRKENVILAGKERVSGGRAIGSVSGHSGMYSHFLLHLVPAHVL